MSAMKEASTCDDCGKQSNEVLSENPCPHFREVYLAERRAGFHGPMLQVVK